MTIDKHTIYIYNPDKQLDKNDELVEKFLKEMKQDKYEFIHNLQAVRLKTKWIVQGLYAGKMKRLGEFNINHQNKICYKILSASFHNQVVGWY